MKHIILAAAVAATPAYAENGLTPEVCGMIGELAQTIMQIRQNSDLSQTAMREHFTTVFESEDSPEMRIAEQMTLNIISAAYAQPKFSTPEYKQSIAVDFRDEHESACYGAIQ